MRCFPYSGTGGLSANVSPGRDAADAKVAELRTMVGERYRDLLSAADSIVRMRGAAEKLVDCLEQAETGLGGVEGGKHFHSLPAHRSPAPQTRLRSALPRSFGEPALSTPTRLSHLLPPYPSPCISSSPSRPSYIPSSNRRPFSPQPDSKA